MFLRLDRITQRLRDTARDEGGATLVAVLVLMAVGFIVSAIIASACLFAIQQTTQGRSNVQAFAAAEAGRDAVVAGLTVDDTGCTGLAGHYAATGAPTYDAWVYAVDDATQPTAYPGAVGANGRPSVVRCPTDDSKYVVIRSIGQGAEGSTTIDAVYAWSKYREQVAGGGLGYMDNGYSASLLTTIDGDTVVKHGNFECDWGATFDGSVYVLDGDVSVGIGNCTIVGELIVNGDVGFERGCVLIILCGYGTLNVGGALKANGNIDVQGTLKVGTDDPSEDIPNKYDVADDPTRDVVASGYIHTSGSLTTSYGGNVLAGAEITAGGSISASASVATNGTLTANASVSAGGAVSAGGNITGGSGVTASGFILAGGSITGNGNRSAGGDIRAVVNIDGNGSKTAGGSVLAKGTISGSGTVTANGGNVHAGAGMSGGARVASGSVLSAAGISTSSNSQTIQAKTGNVIANGAISAVGPLYAGSGEGSPVGDIMSATSIASSRSTTARDILATTSITVDGNCTIGRDVQAGTTVSFDDVVKSGSKTWNSPTCTIARNLYAASSGTKSTLGTYTAPSTCIGNTCLTQGTYPATKLTAASIKVPAGWNGSANRYMTATGTVGTASTGTSAGAPTVTTVNVPTVAAPSAVTLVLNEKSDNTWESFEDLQLRTTWLDLGTTTQWGEDYYVVPALSGSSCSTWFSSTGNVSKMLTNSGNVYIGGVLMAPADKNLVIDATGCTNSVNMSLGTLGLKRDAVILVKKASFNFAAFLSGDGKPHQLYVIQADSDPAPDVPKWGGDPEPVPNCPSGGGKISVSGSGWGNWNGAVSVLLYAPCGVDGSILANWNGHIYVHNNDVTNEVLSKFTCVPMGIKDVIELPCDVDEVTGTGEMNVNAWALGNRLYQTER